MASATRALDELTDQGMTLPASHGYRAVALANLGTGQLWAGLLAESEQTLTDALAEAEGTALDATRVNMLSHLALAHAVSGRLRTAHELASQATRIVEQRGWAPMVQVASAHLALAIVHLQRNELDLALGALADGRPLAAMDRSPGFAVALFQIRIDAARGRLDAARALLARLHRDLGAWQPPQLLERWLRVTEAEVDLAAGEPSAALGRLPLDRPEDEGRLLVSERLLRARALLDLADPHGAEQVLAPLGDAELGPRASVELWVLTAVAADRLREDRRAGEALRRALVAAEPEGVLPSVRRVGSGAAPQAPDPGEGTAPEHAAGSSRSWRRVVQQRPLVRAALRHRRFR